MIVRVFLPGKPPKFGLDATTGMRILLIRTNVVDYRLVWRWHMSPHTGRVLMEDSGPFTDRRAR